MSDSTLIGRPVPRPDAASFINGSGRYLNDIVIPGVGEIFFVRSPYAHARIVGIDSADAEQAPGVQAVVTGQDIESIVAPWTAILTNLGDMKSVPQSAMPTERVRWCGEPVAAIVAESRAQAEDAADRLTIEWEPLPVVADIETAAADDAPLVHPELGTNVAWRLDIDAGEVDAAFARADTVIERRFEVARQTGGTLEPRGMIAQFDAATKQLTLHHGTQVPHIQRAVYATQLGLAENQVRIICPDIGGGFGLKLHVYPDEVATAAISIYLGSTGQIHRRSLRVLSRGYSCTRASRGRQDRVFERWQDRGDGGRRPGRRRRLSHSSAHERDRTALGRDLHALGL